MFVSGTDVAQCQAFVVTVMKLDIEQKQQFSKELYQLLAEHNVRSLECV
jgi:hypothetical protein